MKSSSIRRVRRLPGNACLNGLIVALLALSAAAAAPRAVQTELPTAKPEEAGFSAERLQRIHDAVQRHIDGHRISGAVTLVARNGRVVHFAAHGLMDIEAKKPMRKEPSSSSPR